MRTFQDMHDECNAKGQPCVYWGEHGDWLLAYGTNREADSLTRSNFASLLKLLGGESDTVAVERENHWAVGWVEYILIDPSDTVRVAIADKALDDLRDYPVLDEMHWSDLESDEFFDLAKGELQRYEGWEAVWDEECRNSNSGAGDASAEWAIIEAARERLEALEATAA